MTEHAKREWNIPERTGNPASWFSEVSLLPYHGVGVRYYLYHKDFYKKHKRYGYR